MKQKYVFLCLACIYALFKQLERYGMWGLNTIKVLLDLLPLNL